MTNHNLNIEVIIRQGSVALASDVGNLKNLTDDEVSITAANLAYGLIEECWGKIDE